MRRRVTDYYGYLFLQKKWQHNDDFFELLPTVKQVDYCYVVNRILFQKVFYYYFITSSSSSSSFNSYQTKLQT